MLVTGKLYIVPHIQFCVLFFLRRPAHVVYLLADFENLVIELILRVVTLCVAHEQSLTREKSGEGWYFWYFYDTARYTKVSSTIRAPVYGRHQFFGTSEHYGKAHGSLLSGRMNYNYTACCWFPTSSNILILPSQFWQIRFEVCWLHCPKCRILVLLRY